MSLLLSSAMAGGPARAEGEGGPVEEGKCTSDPSTHRAPATGNPAAKLYKQGIDAIAAKQWEKARGALLEAFQQRPHCKIAANLGWAELMAGKPRDAAEHLSFFLRAAQEVSAADRQRAEEMLAQAKAAIGTVIVRVDVEGAEVRVDGQKVGVSPLARLVFVEPGSRTFEARREGRPPVSQAIEVTAGTAPVVELRTVEKAEPARTPRSRPAAQPSGAGGQRNKALIQAGIGVSAGLAAVGIGTAIGAALTEQASLNDWVHDKCNSKKQTCTDAFNAQEDRRFYLGNTAVWAFLGASVVGGATALYALTGRGPASKSMPSGSLWVGPQGGGIAVTGSF